MRWRKLSVIAIEIHGLQIAGLQGFIPASNEQELCSLVFDRQNTA